MLIEDKFESMILEKYAGKTKVRITAKPDEDIKNAYRRLSIACEVVEMLDRISTELDKISDALQFQERDIKDILKNDYHMVTISLLRNYNRCMGSSAIAHEWKINTGRPSRVFTGSRKKYEKYSDYFESCVKGRYKFTKKGLEFALKETVPEIIEKIESKDS